MTRALRRRSASLKSPIVKHRVLIAYLRFSDPGQGDGTSDQRQTETIDAYSARIGMPVFEWYEDHGKSGYDGEAENFGDLRRLADDIESGKFPEGSILATEALDRLTRRGAVKGGKLIYSILDKGIEIHALKSGRHYTSESTHELHELLATNTSDHEASKLKSGRIADAWGLIRRGTYAGGLPHWFDVKRDFVVEPIKDKPDSQRTKAKIVSVTVNKKKAAPNIRAFHDVCVMGQTTVAKNLNRDGFTTATGKPWTRSAVRQLIRSRSALGEQIECRTENNRAIPTGRVIKNAYPPILVTADGKPDEALWYRANQAIDARRTWDGNRAQSPTVNGRHSEHGFVNIFGTLARCATCGGRMSIRDKARSDQSHFKYLGCYAATHGKCDEKHYHRLDIAERDFLRLMGEAVITETPEEDDPAASILDSIAQKTAEREQRQAAHTFHAKTFFGQAAMARTLADIGEEIDNLTADIAKLESQLAAAKAAKPPAEHIDAVRTLMASLEGMEEPERSTIRSKIANALPSIVKAVKFNFEYKDAPLTYGIGRVRTRKVPAKPIPVSRFKVEIVDKLPLTVPDVPIVSLFRLFEGLPVQYSRPRASFRDKDGNIQAV